MAVLIFLKCLDLRKNVYSRTSSSQSFCRLLVGNPLVQNHARAHAAFGAVFSRPGIVARHAIRCKAANTSVEHPIGYFFAAVGTFAILLFHRWILRVCIYLSIL
jgi:hypothetical protein